jgi:hypothetical protein
VSDVVPTEIRNFSWTISLMPICGYQNPAVTSNLRKEPLVGCSDISGYILLVDAVADTGSVELIYDFGAVPVFVKVEGEIRQPSP